MWEIALLIIAVAFAVLVIFTASFTVADYVLRGHAYFAKRLGNFVIRNTWQAVFPPSGPVELYVRVLADHRAAVHAEHLRGLIAEPVRVQARLRSRMPFADGWLEALPDRGLRLCLDSPQRAVTPFNTL